MMNEKIASYYNEIEKTAARAWKAKIGQIGEDGINKLIDSGVLDRSKELKGLRRGTQNILKKETGKLYRKPEHAAGMFTRATRDSTLANQGIKLSDDEIAATKQVISKMGPFGAAVKPLTDKADRNIAHVRKNAYPKIKGMMEEQMRGYGLDEKLVSIPRKDREAKKWTQAILERHEADEIRFGGKLYNNKKTHINNSTHGKRPVTNFGSHLTPKVVAAESANVAIAPKNTKEVFNKIRRLGESTAGYENTEIGALKNFSGGLIDYGKSGVYNKKGARKAELNVANEMRPFFE